MAALLFCSFCVLLLLPNSAITYQNITRLCNTRSVVTVNGKFPGPRLVAREGDRVIVKVVNHVSYNITIHWHGIRQLTSGWADGPAYVTQCPIQNGQSYNYNFTITGQRGTLLWHAHISWLRSSVYGAIIILPKHNESYPFQKPYEEIPILFGEWFNVDPEAIIAQALQTGAGPNVSDAYTINGLPGPLYNCSSKDTFKLKVKPGKTYLLRLINAALNDELFFSIATTLSPSSKLMPFMLSLLTLIHSSSPQAKPLTFSSKPSLLFLMQSFSCLLGLTSLELETLTTRPLPLFLNTSPSNSSKKLPLFKPTLPPFNATGFVANFTRKFRSLANAKFPANVPQTVDRNFLFTVGLGTNPCPANNTCQGPTNTTKFAASVNNISFALPTVALLQSYFFGKSNSVFTADFPQNPPVPFNYTGTPPNNTMVSNGTKALILRFNTSVQLVLQGTSILGAESHPLHLHGFNFFVVGQGFGNYDPNKDPAKFNLVDPIERTQLGFQLEVGLPFAS
ncbi:hypothetical protein GH714_010041 [Hevea brasiliensis]|uniref:Laccase n=1 Tax=Hevea brasiliensis TaxID=3981 RepID=A0A6A6KMK2_HEVBR|nr:hypothetical protein GH714_010041 [Hevea brasiliensis]